jgi:hypothetical protein
VMKRFGEQLVENDDPDNNRMRAISPIPPEVPPAAVA